MAGEMTVQTGWVVKDVRGQEVGYHTLPTLADPGEVDLRGFFRTVYRGKWILILTMAAAMGATLYWTLNAVPLYSAEVLIVIEARPSSIVRVDEAVQDISTDMAKVDTEVAVLASRGLAVRVIRELGLDKDPEFAPAAWEGVDQASGDPAEAAGEASPAATYPGALMSAITGAVEAARSFLTSAWADYDTGDEQSADAMVSEELPGADLLGTADAREAAALLNRFLSRLSVEPEGQSRLIRVGFTSTSPAKAALIANKVVDEYIKSQLETKSEGARHAAEWLELRLAELGDTVRTLEQNVERQRQDSGSNLKDIVSQRLGQLNIQLADAQAQSVAAGARYEQVRKVLESRGNLDSLPAIIASASIQGFRAKRAELIGTLSELRTIFGPKHPRIIAIQAEINEVDGRVNREINNTLAGLRNEMESAQIHEARLRSDLEALSKEMVHLNEADASIGQVAQRLNANQDLYQNLLKRYTEAVALRDNQQPDARIVSPAQMPLSPSHPNVPRVTALAFIGSASLAVLLLVVTERLRQKLGSVEDVERHVGLRVIGVIPDLSRFRRLASGPRDYIQREPLSEFGGAFQRLRALLTLSNNRVMPRTVLVTSCTGGEGKTTISVCLGIASMTSGQKVLLVDCDFARPQVHRMLDVKNNKGLTDILKGTATLPEAIIQAAGSNLSILTVGRSPDGAIDLLNSARMEALLAELKQIFDIIILDSAPVQVSNALILGGLAEKTIFVTRREWTMRREASYAIKQLQLYGADIAGVVFNRAGAVASYAS
jgi:capsular exopolysaccharide synthesis family protein